MNTTFAKHKLFDGINIKIWLGLTLAAAFFPIMAMPYSFSVSGQSFPALSELLKTALTGFIVNSLIYAVFVYLGLRISKKIGIEPVPVLLGKTKLKENLKLSIILGILVGLVIIVLDKLVFPISVLPVKEGVSLETSIPGPLYGFLASFTGGITEEVQLRLFFVPFFCLVIIGTMKVLKLTKTWKHTEKTVWTAIILASILFGLGHLPATAAVMDIKAIVVIRAILLNGVGGIVFGWLFYKKGLEHAMISHFSADIVLHILLPLLG